MKYDFPKLDLHLHLDGSFRIETVWELAQQQNVQMPAQTLEDYKQFLYDCSNAESVNEYLKMFDAPIAVMQDKASLSRVAYELIEDLAKQGLAYAEIRFAPQLHTVKGMSQAEAVEAVLDGRERALADYPQIRIGILTCMMSVGMPDVNWKQNEETIEVCRQYLGKGVVGIDFAGAEGIVPLKEYKALFDKINEYGIPATCHAGDSQDWHTVEDAMSFGVTRIGHGHHIYENPALCREAIERGITLEICPTSNIQCKTRSSYPFHPAKNLFASGMEITINTDNMTLARTTLDMEYDHCLKEMGFEYNDLILMNMNSVMASFMKEEEKTELLQKLVSCLKEDEE
ncbi:MAG: adenosine deaminase [Erysipelotrichaceae bacterium]|nr:adenosine deaminase [Erysipelotrichaceae bacterium]